MVIFIDLLSHLPGRYFVCHFFSGDKVIRMNSFSVVFGCIFLGKTLSKALTDIFILSTISVWNEQFKSPLIIELPQVCAAAVQMKPAETEHGSYSTLHTDQMPGIN